jgi:hypothetical protein
MDKGDREEYEAAIAKAFIETSRGERFLEVARTRESGLKRNLTPRELKQQSKYSAMMATLESWFDPRCENLAITAHDQHSEARSKLSKLSRPTDCCVMSGDHRIDGPAGRAPRVAVAWECRPTVAPERPTLSRFES